ncbi:MAG TPA: hypothetical protein VK689_18625 [Armatimonadota bacterium]|nr:hypothetical protein [Armatimonadota bacterium]
MSQPEYSGEEIVRRGHVLYEQEIRHRVETENCGKYLIINVATGDYEMDADHLAASDRAAGKYPNAPLFAMRIGYRTLGRIGARRL